ncbi:MAG: hypothetical protein WA667_27985 [Candidatus Nitrosopolaris sp.]
MVANPKKKHECATSIRILLKALLDGVIYGTEKDTQLDYQVVVHMMGMMAVMELV